MTDHNGKETALLVSAPGIIREATMVMLESIAQIGQVALIGGALSAIEQLQSGNYFLLVIDANVPAEEAESLVRWAKQNRPDMSCIVLAKGMVELDRARSAGADAVFLRSSSAQQLAETLWPSNQ